MGEFESPPSPGGGEQIAGAVAEAPAGEAGREAKPRRKTEKREKILKAATELFAREDFQSVLMSDVASAAGVGKGTIYRYFRTKDDLFVQSVMWAIERTIEHLRLHLERRPGTPTALREVIWHLLRFYKENDSLFHILHHHKVEHSCEMRDEIHGKRAELREVVEGVIADGVRDGTFREVDAQFCGVILTGMIRSSMRWYGDAEQGEIVDRLSELFTKGVGS